MHRKDFHELKARLYRWNLTMQEGNVIIERLGGLAVLLTIDTPAFHALAAENGYGMDNRDIRLRRTL